MSKFRIPDVLIGVLLAVAIFALGASSGLLTMPKDDPPRSASVVAQDQHPEPNGRTWLTKDAAGFFAFVAAAIAALQAYLFLRQLRLMNDSLKDSRRAADAAASAVDLARTNGQHQMRAYVGADGIRKDPVLASGAVEAWQLYVRWLNRGQTPALNVRGNFSSLVFGTDGMPVDFDLAAAEHYDPKTPSEYITPTRTFHSNKITIPVVEIETAKSNCRRIYVWGHIEYDDVFVGTKRHRLEFCDEVLIRGSPSDPNCAFQMHGLRHAVFDV